MTKTERDRMEAALADTQRALAAELAYSPELRNHEMVKFYETHIIKLQKFLDGAITLNDMFKKGI